MSNVRISQLPTAQSPITGSELVPVVQNGVTVQTTVSAITQSPSLTETFLTVGQQPLLPNSRYFSAINGIGITDGGAQGAYTIALNGTSGSLESAGTGVIVKSAANTITARSLATSGNGISVTNGSGVSGNPTFQLTGLALALANATGTGLLALGSSSTISPVIITGTSNQIGVTGGDGSSTPTISLASNPVIPGTAGVTLPVGTTAQRGSTTGEIRYNSDLGRFEGYYAGSWQTFGIGDGTLTSVSGTTSQINVSTVGGISTVSLASNPIIPGAGAIQIPSGTTASRPASPVNGDLRYNTTTQTFEGYANGAWGAIVSGSGVTSVGTGTGLTGGPITSTGTISIANTSVTAASYGSSYQVPTFTVNAQGQLTLASNTTIDAVTLTTGSITTTPVNSNDIVNKSYVDSIAQGLSVKAPVLCATTTSITLSGEQTIDGITTSASRVLVKNQATSSQNGIYVSSSGAWSRSSDANTWNQLVSAFVFVEKGTTQADTGWVCTVDPGGTLGVTAVTWVQFSGAGTYTAGTGLTLTGSQFSITNTAVTAGSYGSASSVGTFTVNAQGQITLAGNTSIAIAASQVTSGTFTVSQGGTGVATLTGLAYGNGTSAFTAATAAQIVSAIGSTAVTNATNATTSTNLAGGANGSLPYQTGSGATTFLAAGTNGYVLTLAGGVPTWAASTGGVTSFSAGTTGFTPSTGATGAVTLAGTLNVSNGGTGLTSLTANYIPYGNGTSALQSSANHTFDGTTLTLGNAGVTARFQGDFSNATVASRTAFITGTTNGSTGIYALPNGTSTAASWQATNAADPTNASKILIATNGSTDVQLVSGINGTGTYLPLSIFNGGLGRFVFGTAGQFGIGPIASVSYGTSGQVLQSNGASAAPTWVTPAGGVTLSNDTSTASNLYPTFASATSGSVSTVYTGNANLLYKPSTGEFQSQALMAINGLTLNNATVNTSYTIPTGYNAVSAGPMTIASGVTVTIPASSVWVVV